MDWRDRRGRRRLLAGVVGVLLLAGCTSPPRAPAGQEPATTGGPATTRPAQPGAAGGPPSPERLPAAVTSAGVRRHLEALQRAADDNGGNRAAGTAGYDASVRYVAGQLEAAGYRPQVQRFDAVTSRNRSTPVLELPGAAAGLRAGEDFLPFAFSGSGEAAGPARAVDLAASGPSTSGCQPADFAGFPSGGVAVLQRGGCTFRVKAEQAQRSGAVAALIFDPAQGARSGVLSGTLGGPGIAIPVLATTAEVGDRLAGAGGQQVRVRVDVESRSRPTSNLIAELPGSGNGRVVMVGAHLDSVEAGPGMNDNASGSAAILEIARQLAGTRPAHTIRFAWWGGEELGLLGSRHYVGQLRAADRDRLALYLNVDMAGSRNFRRLVYDGDARGAPSGSAAIERVLGDYLRGRRLAVGEATLGGGSDHASFAAAGIPIGGVFTGAGEDKSARERDAFGGTAGEPADPCYHRRCDDLSNVDLAVLDQMADAVAHALATFARDTAPVDRARG